MHAIVFSTDADADRAFLRDVFGLAAVDAGGGWLIFKAPPAEIAVHPSDGEPRHELFFLVDDIATTLDDLSAQGVTVVAEPSERRYGIVARIAMPSGAEIEIYEPRHPLAKDL
jgi:catechol 2,3-dioxygenase-like lactoylglutathione lyase family enzyme